MKKNMKLIFALVVVVGLVIVASLILGSNDRVESETEEGQEEVQKNLPVESVTEAEYKNVQEYMQMIYGIYEPLPEFNTINEASEDWVWMMALYYLQETKVADAYTATEAEEAARTLFGDDFNKKITKDSSKHVLYRGNNMYRIAGMGLKMEYCFVIKDMTRRGDKYTVNIVEYIRSFEYEGDKMREIVYKNDEIMTSYLRKHTRASNDAEMKKRNDESALVKAQFDEFVLNNEDKFNVKKVVIEKDKDTRLLHIVSSKNIDK